MIEREETRGQGNTGELNPYAGSESIFATAQHPQGLPVKEINAETLVTIDGVQSSVAFWVAEGRLQRDANGAYSEREQEAPKIAEDTGEYLPLTDDSHGPGERRA